MNQSIYIPPARLLPVLKTAREKISNPKAWTQGHYAKDQSGTVDEPCSGTAVSWCAAGAISAALGFNSPAKLYETGLLEFLGEVAGWNTITMYNDYPTRTHAEILEVFDKAIKLMEKRKALVAILKRGETSTRKRK